VLDIDFRVGLLWRAEWDAPPPGAPIMGACKLRGVFEAFRECGVQAQPVVYSDDAVEPVREQLLDLDCVLVWVNPIEQGHDRSRLDPLLRDAADAGVFVSAHPDVILRMGTKEVLVETCSMTWGSDTRIYRTTDELRAGLPSRLAEAGPLVLKQHRGMGGNGVWKVEVAGGENVGVQHAAGGAAPETIPLEQLFQRCEPYFAGTGLIVEQPYQARLAEGMIRAYFTHDRVVGFTHQFPRGLLPPDAEPGPSGKVFDQADEPRYSALRQRLETVWVPEMQQILGLETFVLPVIWDADFFYGPKDEHGDDTFVLCEINVSSTFAFPEFAMAGVARAAIDAVARRR
jgi:uncharacterized protein DUF6815